MKKDLPTTTKRRQERMERQTKMPREVRAPTRTREARGRGATTNPGVDTNHFFINLIIYFFF